MSDTKCPSITLAGKRCGNLVRESGYGFSHDPALADARAEGRLRGGKGKSSAARARKAIPADLRDVADVLLQAIRDVESGALPEGKASALATLSRAYVAVYEAGLVESKIADIERKISERAAS